MRLALTTALALVAFAANSILCRMALGAERIDAASFTSLRLLAGAATLALLVRGRARGGSWSSAALLFIYAIAFSFAYLELGAGLGALLLFGAVQLTMIASGLLGGERPRVAEWVGMLVALGGLIYLVSPGISAPAPLPAAAMALAGIAWGGYSLRGRGSRSPLGDTAGNFLRALPFAGLVWVATLGELAIAPRGALLAVASGAIASGLGYVVWYRALGGLSATRAATVQLAVPVIAALGGVALLDERPTPRLVVAGVAILGGIALAIRKN